MSQVGRDSVLEQFDTKTVGDREVDPHLGPGRLVAWRIYHKICNSSWRRQLQLALLREIHI